MSEQNELAKRPEQIGAFGMYAPPEIHIECEAFTGSLAMLFQCVKDRQIDLLGVPLAPICEAYFRYLIDNAEHDLESAAVALAGLSYLIERKAWLLLPVDEEPDGDELLEVLEPYIDEFRPAIEALKEKAEERESLFFRSAEGEAYELPFDSTNVSVDDLARVLQRLIERAVPDDVAPPARPQRSLSEMMGVVLRALPQEFQTLDVIVVGEFTRTEVVWWFLALLELIRLGQARVQVKAGEVSFKAEQRD
ncbi:MAG TPA: segregation/condensation protein A, partial [Fimbriimonadaceae bacterium]|nr:segregation/condensation protein A [Fimbriimonadaceae bacterium]